MAQNKAIVVAKAGDARILDVPYPTLPGDDYMIVKTTAVAINPTDWKHVNFASQLGNENTRVGCDYAGVVQEVGPAVTQYKPGDRVCGFINGCNKFRDTDGAYATYAASKAPVQGRVPKGWSDEQAATLGVSITTVGQGLYQTLGLQLPAEPTQDKTPLLIYGGTTATGIYGIQFAKLSGYTVITTGSPKNHELLKSLGADHVFDYRSPTLVQDIRAAAGDNLSYAWDCHADQASANVCARALNQDGAHYAGLLGGIDRAVKAANPKAKVSVSLGYTSFGEDAWLGALYPASQADFDFAKKFWPLAIDLLDEGKVKPIAIDVNRGGSGLEGVLVGLKELAAGKVSAQKLVYTL